MLRHNQVRGGRGCGVVWEPVKYSLQYSVLCTLFTKKNLHILGTVHCIRETVIRDGFRGLYAGTLPSLAANIGK